MRRVAEFKGPMELKRCPPFTKSGASLKEGRHGMLGDALPGKAVVGYLSPLNLVLS
jgi:hypothetical protein